jgi:hypothetical protein
MERVPGTLGRVGGILNAFRYEYLARGTELFWIDEGAAKGPQATDPALQRLVSSVSEVVRDYRREFETSREPWDKVIELCEGVFGRTWLSFRLATIAVGKTAMDCSESPSAISWESRPIDVALMARDKRSDPQWWHAYAEAAEDELSRRAWLLLFLRYATPATLRENLERADGICQRLASFEYRGVIEGLGRGPMATTIPRRNAVLLMSSAKSARLRFALGMRSARDLRLEAVHQLSESDMSSDPMLAELGLEWVLEENPTSDDERGWRTLAREASRLYAFSGDLFSGIHFGMPASRGIPVQLAKEILEECDRYPGSLIAIADQSVSSDYQKKLHSAAAISKRARWAAN